MSYNLESEVNKPLPSIRSLIGKTIGVCALGVGISVVAALSIDPFIAHSPDKNDPRVREEMKYLFDNDGQDYRYGTHVCKDIAQTYRDDLVMMGFDYDNLRLVRGTNKKNPDKGHMWLEVRSNSWSDDWKIFDPTHKFFDADLSVQRNNYNITGIYPGDFIYQDPRGLGYSVYGDVWIHSRKEWGNINTPATETLESDN